MSLFKTMRLRATLFATSSLVASTLAVGAGGIAAMAPSAAWAINECGDPATNLLAADSFNCPAGTYPTGIVYPITAGALTLNLQEDATGAVKTTTGGIQVVGAPTNSVTIVRSASVAGTGDPSIVNLAGTGIGLTTNGANLTLNLTDPDAGDTPIVVTGSTTGISAISLGKADVAVTLTNGTVTGQAGDGIDANTKTGSVTVNSGAATITANNTGVAGVAIGIAAGNQFSISPGYATGGITLTGAGAISATADYAAEGIQAIGDGPITITETGPINVKGGFGYGVVVLATAGAPVNVTTGAVTLTQTAGAGGDGIFVYSVGPVNVTAASVATTGANSSGIRIGPQVGVLPFAGNTKVVSGTISTVGDSSPGIEVYAHGAIDITSASITTTGKTSNGIIADTDLSTVAINSGTISAAGAGSNGIDASAATGVAVTSGGVTAGATAIKAITVGGPASVTTTGGAIVANAGDGIDVNTKTGAITVATGASSITATNASVGGIAIGIAAGNQLSLTPGYATGGITITGAGPITATADYAAVGVQAVGDGPIAITETGPINVKGGFGFGVVVVASAAAPVTVNTSAITLNQTSATAGGDGIFVYSVGPVNVTSGTISTTGLNSAGIRVGPQVGVAPLAGNTKVVSGAITTTGDTSPGIEVYAHGSVDITSASITTTGKGSYGISTDSDLSTVAINSGVISATGAGSVGIRATGATGVAVTTTGLTTTADDGINVISGAGYTVTTNGSITAGGNAIQVASAKGGTVNVGPTAIVRGLGTSPATAVIDVVTPAGQTTTVNNAGIIRSTNATVAGAASDLAIRTTGASVVLNNSGRIDGRMDYSALAAGSKVTVNNTGAAGVHTSGLTTFSAGNDTFNNTAPGLLATSGATTYDFGADTGVAPRDVFNNSGSIVVGETAAPATFTLTGLEAFNNSGQIVFGSTTGGASSDHLTTSRLVMTGTGGGTAFVGSGASLLVFDANLGTTPQTNCAAAVTADCLSLPGGVFSGTNHLRVINTSAGGGGFNTGIVLVDAPGGSVAPGSFTLDSGSTNYVVRGGQGGVDTGFFVYRLVPIGTTQIALVSAPDNEAFQFVTAGTVSNDIWYTTTGGWFDREADIRQGLTETGGGKHAGVWIKMVGDWTRRRSIQSTTLSGATFITDNSYNQNTAAVIGGVDLISGSSDTATWVLGVNAGYVDSNLRYRASPTRTNITGGILGAYASVVSGGWYVDGTVAGDFLKQTVIMPTLNPVTPLNTSGKLKTWGGQLESGYRFGAMGLQVEPFASFAYVRTSFDDLIVPGGSVQFANAVSERGSLGLRVSSAMPMGGWTLKPTVYGRVWDEFKGNNSTILVNPGTPFMANDNFHGMFGEVGGQVALFSKGGVSAFVDGSYKWKAGYQAYTARIGMNYRF